MFPKKIQWVSHWVCPISIWQDPRNHIQMVKNSPRRRLRKVPLRSMFLGGSIIHIQMQKWIFTYSNYSIPPSTDSWYWSQQITIFSYVLICSHIFSLPNRPNRPNTSNVVHPRINHPTLPRNSNNGYLRNPPNASADQSTLVMGHRFLPWGSLHMRLQDWWKVIKLIADQFIKYPLFLMFELDS